jgi:hypothetical protein
MRILLADNEVLGAESEVGVFVEGADLELSCLEVHLAVVLVESTVVAFFFRPWLIC